VLDSSSYFVCVDKSTQLGIGFSTRVASGNFRIHLGILLTSQKGHSTNLAYPPDQKPPSDLYHQRSSSSRLEVSPRILIAPAAASSSNHLVYTKSFPPKTKSEPEIPTLPKISPRFGNNSKSQTMRVHSSPRRNAIPSSARSTDHQPEIPEGDTPTKRGVPSRSDSRTRMVSRVDVDKTQGTSSGLES